MASNSLCPANTLTVGALLLATSLDTTVSGRVLLRERDFFGVIRVTEIERGRVHRLFHGSTLHGQQSLEPARRGDRLTGIPSCLYTDVDALMSGELSSVWVGS